MAVATRTILEVLIPLLAVYLLVGAPAFTIPSSLREPLRAYFNPTSQTCPANARTEAFSRANLDWAISTLAPHADIATAARCPQQGYAVHVYAVEPLVLYIESFLSASEAKALSTLAEGRYEPATVFSSTGEGAERNDTAVRRSEKAPLPRDAPLVSCVEERARALQGWRDDVFIERLWAQRYEPGGHYAHHFDWGSDGGRRGGRVSSFMVWLGDACGGGGTNFPHLPRRETDEWCGRIECGPGVNETGTTFVPRAGSAVYWENFRRSDGKGYQESLHAGLPVTAGEKIGLNIWSWWQPGLAKALAEELATSRVE